MAKTASSNSQTWLFMTYVVFDWKRVKAQNLGLKRVCCDCSKYEALFHFAWSHLLRITSCKHTTLYLFKLAAQAAMWPDATTDCNILYQKAGFKWLQFLLPLILVFFCVLQPKSLNNCSFLSFSHIMSNPCASAPVSHGEDRGPNQECS